MFIWIRTWNFWIAYIVVMAIVVVAVLGQLFFLLEIRERCVRKYKNLEDIAKDGDKTIKDEQQKKKL